MTQQHVTQDYAFQYPEVAIQLYGTQDKHIHLLEKSFDVTIRTRQSGVSITGNGDAVEQVGQLYKELEQLLATGTSIQESDIVTAIKMAKNGTLSYFLNLYEEEIGRTYDGKPIRAKNFGQKQYLNAIKKRTVTFGVGPAGTGKTFLAVVMAVQALKKGEVRRIILTRPAVEAGENLGFLPGDLKEKVDPYLRPIYDALYSIYGREHTERLIERGVIEIAPLAYMRGRTLDEAFVILDEAQNTTIAQMKMFLTRLGFGSKMIVNGDMTQIDLPRGAKSGLVDAIAKLKNIEDIAHVTFDAEDVVRHPVVSAIINAYADEEKG